MEPKYRMYISIGMLALQLAGCGEVKDDAIITQQEEKIVQEEENIFQLQADVRNLRLKNSELIFQLRIAKAENNVLQQEVQALSAALSCADKLIQDPTTSEAAVCTPSK